MIARISFVHGHHYTLFILFVASKNYLSPPYPLDLFSRFPSTQNLYNIFLNSSEKMTQFTSKPTWWIPAIDDILDSQYDDNTSPPFDIKSFKSKVAGYTTTCYENGKRWDPTLFDIDLVIGIIDSDTGRSYEPGAARKWVLNRQWTGTEPKRYQELGIVCICGREEDGKVYMRVENLDKSDKSGIGFPRAGCCGSEEVWVLNPMPKAHAAKSLDEHAVRRCGKKFKRIHSNQIPEVLKDVRYYRKALVRQWLSCQRAVKQAETGVGKTDDPSELRKCKDELAAAKKELDDAGGVFLWNKAYEDMPKVQEDNFA